MAKTQYTVPQVPGSSRKSDRPYTHAIIGRRNVAAALKVCGSTVWLKCHGTTFDYLARTAPAKVAGVTREAFIAQCVADARADLVRRHGPGDAGEFEVLQWSMSAKNAAAKLSFWSDHYVDVRVVECVPVVK